MNDRPREFRQELRTLDAFQLQAQNLSALLRRRRSTIERLQAQHPELAADLLGTLENSDLEGTLEGNLIPLLTQLRGVLEQEAGQ